MKKSNIYTRTGDEGSTSLLSGTRELKSHLRIDLYGEFDELNSRIGFSVALMPEELKSEIDVLTSIQSKIFDLGSNMACEPEKREKFKLPQISDEFIKTLESEIDRMEASLKPLKNFILPGGARSAASIHLARTSARCVERKAVYFKTQFNEDLPVNTLKFLNRLSDYFFVLARYVNFYLKKDEVYWRL